MATLLAQFPQYRSGIQPAGALDIFGSINCAANDECA